MNRREFLQKSGTGLAGLALCSLARGASEATPLVGGKANPDWTREGRLFLALRRVDRRSV